MIITAPNKDLLDQVAEKCKKLGCNSVKCIAIDLSTIDNCKSFTNKCISHFDDKRIDYLFLNHVIGHYSEWINNRNLKEFDMNKRLNNINNMLHINVTAYISIATLLYEYLEENNGRIICVSSFAAYSNGPYTSIYAASKRGVSTFFENWRIELLMNKSNVSITICILSLVATKAAMTAVKGILSESTVKRAANPNDIAKQIISGGQARLKYVYCPFNDIFGACLLQRIAPSVMTMISCYMNYKRLW